MAEISGNALVMAIQAVDEKIWSLKAHVEQADENDPGLADVEEEMLAFSGAANELRIGYEQELKESGNLPAYESLVRVARRSEAGRNSS